MHKLTYKLKELGVRRIAFSIVVLAYVGFLGYINVMMLLPGSGIAAMGHFDFFSTGDTHDLIHELVFAFIIGTAAVGLFSQLWRPKEDFAGQLIALFAWGALIITAAITGNWVPQPLFIIFGGLTLLATILHPAGRGLFNWFGTARINKVLLSLVAIAAVPLLVFSFTNFNLQIAGGGGGGGTGFSGLFSHQIPTHGVDSEPTQDQQLDDTDEDEVAHDEKHSALGHYRNLTALSLIIILLGLLTSFRPKGGRLAAWVAGVLPVLLGLASVVLPAAESSLGVAWGVIAILWGLAFIAVAEFAKDQAFRWRDQ